MPNAIKYSTSPQTLALKKGNFWIGTGDSAKGPTSVTDYWSGISPATGGYTIYLNKSGSQGPSIYAATGDTELVGMTNRIAGTSFTTRVESLNWFSTQTDKMVFNIDYPQIITNGLVLNLDAGFTPSYPETGSSWYDISVSGVTGTLVNSPTFNSLSNSGSLDFNGTSNYVSVPKQSALVSSANFSVSAWVKRTTSSSPVSIWQGASNINDVAIKLGSTGAFFEIGDSSTNTYGFVANTSSEWQNLAMVFDGTLSGNSNRLKGYVNGIPQTLTYTGTIPATSGTVDSSFFIGNNGGFNTDGSVAIVQIYNRSLSDSEVFTNYNAQIRTEDFDPDALAYITEAGFTNDSLKTIINDFYLSLKSNGYYTKITHMKLNLTDSTNNATSLTQCSIDGILPGTNSTVYTNTPTANYSGVTYNGTTQYAQLGYNPGTDGALALDNTALMGYVYSTGAYLSWAQRSVSPNNIGLLTTTANQTQDFINDSATILSLGGTDPAGFNAASRNTDLNTKHVIRANSTGQTTVSEVGTAPTGRASFDLMEGARTLDGTAPDAYYNMRSQFLAVGKDFSMADLEGIETIVNNLQGSVDTLFGLSGTSARKRY
jgi:hypothetical protein